MANILTLTGSTARMEPENRTIFNIIKRPFLFLLFVIIISIGTNMMPFYKDGSRMNLYDGGLALLNKKGAITYPYEIPQNGPSHTAIINKRKPLKKNPITLIAYSVSDIFKVDPYTGIILLLCMVSMLYNMVVAFNELQFDKIEREVYKKAFDPGVHTKELKDSYPKLARSAYIFTFIVSAIVSIGFTTLIIYLGKGKMVNSDPILIPVFSAIFIVIFVVKLKMYSNKSYFFHRMLIARRCYNCYHMDCFRITGRDYVKTEVTTSEYYYLNQNGSRGKTYKTDKKERDIYNYHIICENCGDTSTITL